MTPLYKVTIWAAVVLAAIALVLGLTALAHSMPAPAQQTPPVGAMNVIHVENGPWGFPLGLVFGNKLEAQENWGTLSLGVGQNDIALTNTSAQTLYIDYGQLTTTGVASSSFRAYVYSTTTSTIAPQHWNTALAFSASSTAIIRNVVYATSTSATTTNSTMAAVSGRGDGTISVLPGSTLHLTLQTVDSIACQVAGACEMATSTNRGIQTLTFRFHYMRFDGQSQL